jgi:parallel beta-helix repeat protein
MFGAVGDNSTDDSVALQAMIDYAEDNGTVIQLPFKSYAFSTELDIPSGCTIRGVRNRYSWQDGYYGSRLRYTGSGNALNLTAATGYHYKITLEDFALQGAGTSIMNGVGTGIYAKAVSEFWFRDLDIRGFETGIYGNDLTIGEITSCDISWNDQGIYLPFASRISIRDNNIWNNGVGVRQSATTNIVIENNQFERCTDFLKFDSSYSNSSTTVRPIVAWNNFNSDPDLYTSDDGLAPYWDCHMINITNQDYPGNVLILNDGVLFGNWVSIYKTDGPINVDFATNTSYAYLHLHENGFVGMNTSVIDETGSGTAVSWWNGNTIYNGKAYGSGNVQVAGTNFGWDSSYVLGKLVLNTTASSTEGAMWYDASAKKMKFYNGTAVETINSS